MPPPRPRRPPAPSRTPASAPTALPARVEAFLDLVAEWRATPVPLRHLLRRRAERLRSLPSHERRDLEALLFGYARWRDRIDAAVERAVRALPPAAPRTSPRRRALMARAALLAIGHEERAGTADGLVDLGVDQRRLETHPGDLCLEADEARALVQALTTPPAHRDPAGRLAELHAFPRAVVAELLGRLGEPEAEAALAALNRRAPLQLRARHPADADRVVAALAATGVEALPHPLIPGAVEVPQRARLERHDVLRQGLAAVQDGASQLAALLLDVEPGQTVVDYCAGGGGKAEAIGDRLAGRGRLVLLDLDRRRLAQARRRVQRAPGLRLETLLHDGLEPLPRALLQSADRVLVDAPCTGLGTVRRHPDLKWRYGEVDLRAFADRQLRLAQRAASGLRAGGRLLYTTCSLRRAENEAVAEALAADPRLRPLPLVDVLGPRAQALGSEGAWLTLWPHRHRCDGFFYALFERC